MTDPHPDYYAGVKDAVYAHATHIDDQLLVGTMRRPISEVFKDIDRLKVARGRYADGIGGGDLSPFEQPEKGRTFAVAVQVFTLIEGEDSDGYYTADDVIVPSRQVMAALIDAIGRTESGMGFEFEADLTGDGTTTTVKAEWDRAWFVPPRHD